MYAQSRISQSIQLPRKLSLVKNGYNSENEHLDKCSQYWICRAKFTYVCAVRLFSTFPYYGHYFFKMFKFGQNIVCWIYRQDNDTFQNVYCLNVNLFNIMNHALSQFKFEPLNNYFPVFRLYYNVYCWDNECSSTLRMITK